MNLVQLIIGIVGLNVLNADVVRIVKVRVIGLGLAGANNQTQYRDSK